MTIEGLFCHTAEVQTKQQVNINGRITETWTTAGTIKCRFTQPAPSSAVIVQGADKNVFSSTVYAGIEFLSMTATSIFPVRLLVYDEGWAGTYEVRNQARVLNDYRNPHHVEFEAVKVYG